MQELAKIDVHIKDILEGSVSVVQWTRADPFPRLGPHVGVDTETELITETDLAPPLVVLGVFDPQSATCYISYWEDAAVFINQLSKLEVRQYYFNLAPWPPEARAQPHLALLSAGWPSTRGL